MADDADIQRLHDRLLSDDDLLEEFKRDPHGVLQRHNIELTEEEHSRLDAQNLHVQSTEEVRAKIQTYTLKTMF